MKSLVIIVSVLFLGLPAAEAARSIKEPSLLADPERLREIVEKSIAAGSGSEGDSLELPVNGRITSTVGMRPDPSNGTVRMHKGIDIAIPEGTPVTPVAGGRIAYSGMQPGYGNMVIVQHDDGMVSIYAHHKSNRVTVGSRVDRDTVLALSGSTGHSTGPHLHFEAWLGKKNVTPLFLESFSGKSIEESTHGSIERTNLKKVLLSDGTLLFVEKNSRINLRLP